jgi:tetratricopeptide (TPR) repeat protein
LNQVKTPILLALALLLALSGPGHGAGSVAAPPSIGMAGADALLAGGDDVAAAKAYEALGPQTGTKREGWRQNNWGLALLRLDKPAGAEEHFEKAVEVDRANFIARANLGAAWEREGDLTKALDVYGRALELVRAQNRALARGRKDADADEESKENLASPQPLSATPRLIEKTCTLGPVELKAALAKANDLLDKGLYAQAGDAYAAIGRTTPPQREGWRLNNWGLCYLRLSEPALARERLDRSVRAFPANPVAWNNLAVAYEEMGLTDYAEIAWSRGGGSAGAKGADPQRLELVRAKLAFSDARRLWEALRRR